MDEGRGHHQDVENLMGLELQKDKKKTIRDWERTNATRTPVSVERNRPVSPYPA